MDKRLTAMGTWAASAISMVVVLTCTFFVVALSRECIAQQERLVPKDVTWRNVEIFEDQIRRDLPMGTSIEVTEDYLARLKIRYDPPSAIWPNTILAVIENLGHRDGLLASLAISIEFGDGKVKWIRFRVQYL